MILKYKCSWCGTVSLYRSIDEQPIECMACGGPGLEHIGTIREIKQPITYPVAIHSLPGGINRTDHSFEVYTDTAYYEGFYPDAEKHINLSTNDSSGF